jgi:transcriptional regulator with XRE-family HTH domain
MASLYDVAKQKFTVKTPHLGRRIRVAREALKPELTRAALGRELGINETGVYRYERGFVTPPGKAYPTLMEVLKKPRDYFVDEPLELEIDETKVYPNLRILMQAPEWGRAHPEARRYVLGLHGSHGDMDVTDWGLELRHADKMIRAGFRPEVPRDEHGNEIGEEDVVEDPEEDA